VVLGSPGLFDAAKLMVSACIWTVSTFRAVGGTGAAAVMTVQHLFSAVFLGLLPVLLLLVLICYGRCRCLGFPDCGAAVFVGYGIVMGLNSVGHLWISVSYPGADVCGSYVGL
jgi:hypothetical protein